MLIFDKLIIDLQSQNINASNILKESFLSSQKISNQIDNSSSSIVNNNMKVCQLCSMEGHTARECHVYLRCERCKSFGHLSIDCKNIPYNSSKSNEKGSFLSF